MSLPIGLRFIYFPSSGIAAPVELELIRNYLVKTMGALILQITSSEKYHQIGTLENRPLNKEEVEIWVPVRNLSDSSSKTINAHEIDYYLQIMD